MDIDEHGAEKRRSSTVRVDIYHWSEICKDAHTPTDDRSVLYNHRSLLTFTARGILSQAEIGIIGGSGLYSMPGLDGIQEIVLETPFGAPSDAYVLGTLEGRQVAFLARHGRGHRILPSALNFRANIHGFKQLGVERILSVSAVG